MENEGMNLAPLSARPPGSSSDWRTAQWTSIGGRRSPSASALGACQTPPRRNRLPLPNAKLPEVTLAMNELEDPAVSAVPCHNHRRERPSHQPSRGPPPSSAETTKSSAEWREREKGTHSKSLPSAALPSLPSHRPVPMQGSPQPQPPHYILPSPKSPSGPHKNGIVERVLRREREIPAFRNLTSHSGYFSCRDRAKPPLST